MITDKDVEDVFDSLYEYQNKKRTELLSELKHVLANIDYPSYIIKDLLRESEYTHIGYCTVSKSTYRSTSYPTYDFYTVDGGKVGSEDIYMQLMRQDDNDDNTYHNLVYQTSSGIEDSYIGFIFIPLNNGQYWVLHFED